MLKRLTTKQFLKSVQIKPAKDAPNPRKPSQINPIDCTTLKFDAHVNKYRQTGLFTKPVVIDLIWKIRIGETKLSPHPDWKNNHTANAIHLNQTGRTIPAP
jgi:hypothetical protein